MLFCHPDHDHNSYRIGWGQDDRVATRLDVAIPCLEGHNLHSNVDLLAACNAHPGSSATHYGQSHHECYGHS